MFMNSWEKVRRANFFIKLKSWEYWPFGIVQFPAIIYWLWLSIRARSLVFFSASNPAIPMGGMFGESKYDVLKKIPPRYVPQTLLISFPVSTREVSLRIQEAGMRLPVIFKPDIGERGYLVKTISDEKDITAYLRKIRGSFLVQERVQLPLEFGVFYMKMPTDKSGKVFSVVAKEMLSVTGDGKSTLKELIFRNDRAKLQSKTLEKTYWRRLTDIIPEGDKIELVSIGNHCLGTRFLNANHLINDRLSNTFDSISGQIPGFYFGRFDLRCGSVEDLYAGRVQIMELNGCGAEPAHIYDPQFPLWEALAERVRHWDRIFRVSSANRKNGFRYATLKEALGYYRKFRSTVR